ncbi:hypothetical protein ACMHYB_35085 [Sorangium sp. So ce1128]
MPAPPPEPEADDASHSWDNPCSEQAQASTGSSAAQRAQRGGRTSATAVRAGEARPAPPIARRLVAASTFELSFTSR